MIKKCGFITGASRGIGKGVAFALAEMGFQTVLVATDKAKLEAVAQEITTAFSLTPDEEPLVFPVDVSSQQEVARAVDQSYLKTKRFDLLFNGAGIAKSGTSELSLQDLVAMLNINLVGTFNCVHAIAPYMKQNRSGYIFNVSSRAGKIGISTIGGYAASKFAVAGLAESLFNELASYGIKVSTLFPGYVNTDMAAGRSTLADEDKIEVADIVKTVQFLLSLSAHCCIKEVVLECRKTVELMNAALLQGKKGPPSKDL